ncbi:MAG: L,D-transpeptidase family protein, partial [Micromonosporaceae bacterium]|nr:L,D-transpeptidase family protein [Micromonosporaceae bacterium]
MLTRRHRVGSGRQTGRREGQQTGRREGRRAGPRARSVALAAAVCCPLLVLGCDSGGPRWHDAGDTGSRDGSPNITITQPAPEATGVPTSAEIVYSATDASDPAVELLQEAVRIPGEFRSDGSSWVPAKQLKYSTRYTATVTVTVRGKTQSEAVSFTTMAKPSATLRVSSVIGDDQVVGVGMPIIITLGGDVARDQRAAVQRRLFVTSDPPQEGAWNWFNAHEIHFRPREYWQASTRLSFRAALGGLPLGGDRYGANDITVRAAVGSRLLITIENQTKQMTVTEDGSVLRTIPVSLGKPSSPSASGNLIIMAKQREEWFDSSTYGVPADSADGYRTLVKFTQRLTWDGEYIHAAPWSVGDQGRRNVSHGCTNISEANAKWLFGVTHIGDPVIIKNTEQHVRWGNGYTDWELTFEEYARGGAEPTTASGSAAAPSAPSA